MGVELRGHVGHCGQYIVGEGRQLTCLAQHRNACMRALLLTMFVLLVQPGYMPLCKAFAILCGGVGLLWRWPIKKAPANRAGAF